MRTYEGPRVLLHAQRHVVNWVGNVKGFLEKVLLKGYIMQIMENYEKLQKESQMII